MDRLKETVRREIERGAALTPGDIAAAHVMRDRLIARMAAFQKTYEFFALPTVQVAPFDIERPYVTSITGLALPTYIDWMRSCYYVSIRGGCGCRPMSGFILRGSLATPDLLTRPH